MSNDYLWGIDLGGTKTEGIVLKRGDISSPVCRLRIPTESEKGYETVKANILNLVEMMRKQTGLHPAKMGICTPGIVDVESQSMKNCNSTCLNGKPLKKDLESELGITLEIANDANCFALAEATMGIVPEKVPHAKVVFGVILGTGVGGGVVINGRAWNGSQGIAGEWGHNTLIENGEPCYCGKKGCVEQVISGPALEAYYKTLSGKSKSLANIVEDYKTGKDEYAQLTLKRLTTMFGKAIATVINILDPDAIVLGGGVGNIDLLYTEGKNEIMKHVFNNNPKINLLKPKLGDSAGVFGAAVLLSSLSS
jgi:predicted NBD/HSP70 family sugar kinase